MWTWTHLMVSTIILGPSPEMFWGTVLPDAFDYVNWAHNFRRKKVNVKMLLKEEHKFNKRNNEGLIWDIDQLFHSFTCTIITVALSFYFLQNNSPGLFAFFAAWSLHVLLDYLTHTDQIYPFFPFTKWGIRLGIINYNPKNVMTFVFDGILFVLFLFRIGWLHF